jgi:hypothetical protein
MAINKAGRISKVGPKIGIKEVIIAIKAKAKEFGRSIIKNPINIAIPKSKATSHWELIYTAKT